MHPRVQDTSSKRKTITCLTSPRRDWWRPKKVTSKRCSRTTFPSRRKTSRRAGKLRWPTRTCRWTRTAHSWAKLRTTSQSRARASSNRATPKKQRSKSTSRNLWKANLHRPNLPSNTEGTKNHVSAASTSSSSRSARRTPTGRTTPSTPASTTTTALFWEKSVTHSFLPRSWQWPIQRSLSATHCKLPVNAWKIPIRTKTCFQCSRLGPSWRWLLSPTACSYKWASENIKRSKTDAWAKKAASLIWSTKLRILSLTRSRAPSTPLRANFTTPVALQPQESENAFTMNQAVLL